MRAWLLLISTIVFGALPAQGQGPAVKAEILSYGLFESKVAETQDRPETAAGKRDVVADFKLLKQTDIIVAKIGVEFGIEFRVSGVPATQKDVMVAVVTRFPPPGLTNSKGERFAEEKTNVRVVPGRREYEGYTFEEKWELAAGEWVFEVYFEGRKLAERRFTVVLP
jgi:hypothetical protein